MKRVYLMAGFVAVLLGGLIWWHEGDAARARAMNRPLPDLRNVEPRVERCGACGGVVSTRAERCPHCGEPRGK